MNTITKVIIPAHNEEKSIAKVIQDLPSTVDEIVVVSNNSSDETVGVAKKAGATVLTEKRRGYGYACLKGISYIKSKSIKPDIIVFLDGDYSDYPKELNKLIAPIINEDFDFVVGARSKKLREKGSMTAPQIFGNWLATSLMAFFLIQNSQI